MTERPEPWVGPVRYRWGRRIGPWGTSVRILLSGVLVVWAVVVPHRHPVGDLPGSGVLWWNVVLGLVVFPGLVTGALALRGRHASRLRAGTSAALAVSVVVVALAQVLPVAVLLALAATFAVQVLRGDAACELLAIPNWVLRRDDRLLCLPLTPIDRAEAARHRRVESVPRKGESVRW